MHGWKPYASGALLVSQPVRAILRHLLARQSYQEVVGRLKHLKVSQLYGDLLRESPWRKIYQIDRCPLVVKDRYDRAMTGLSS